MPEQDREISDILMQRTSLPADLNGIRETILSYRLVKDCGIEIQSIRGHQTGPDTFALSLDGLFQVQTKVLLKLKIDASGSGELDATTRKLRLNRVEIRNDFEGLLTTIASMSGFAPGRELPLNDKAIGELRAALQEATDSPNV